MYTIKLGDGTELRELELSGNVYVSKAEVSEETFAGKLHGVTITDGEGNTEKHDYMKFDGLTVGQGEWLFVLNDLSKNEIERARLEATVEYLAMMTEVEI